MDNEEQLNIVLVLSNMLEEMLRTLRPMRTHLLQQQQQRVTEQVQQARHPSHSHPPQSQW